MGKIDDTLTRNLILASRIERVVARTSKQMDKHDTIDEFEDYVEADDIKPPAPTVPNPTTTHYESPVDRWRAQANRERGLQEVKTKMAFTKVGQVPVVNGKYGMTVDEFLEYKKVQGSRYNPKFSSMPATTGVKKNGKPTKGN
jgi:hypothetical protein